MENQTWKVLFTDKAGESHELQFQWAEHPDDEVAARHIIQQHQDRQEIPVIIDIERTDLTPKQTQMEYFGYKIVDIRLVQDHPGT